MKTIGLVFYILGFSLIISPATIAQSKPVGGLAEVKLSEQKTETALLLIAEQFNVQIMFDPALVSQLKSPAVSGKMSLQTAVGHVLKGSKLTVKKVSSGVYVIIDPPPKIQEKSGDKQVIKRPRRDSLNSQAIFSEKTIEEIEVVGSQVKGAKVVGALPVTLVTVNEIDVTGASSFEELLGNIPQAGLSGFNSAAELSNDTRGDIASINLRTLGADTTLVLLNGRRMVAHPQTQVFGGVPIQFVNMNSIPVSGLDRIEVLRDGAAALYGTDAVAGVINAVMTPDTVGLNIDVRYADVLNSRMDELLLNVSGGKRFYDGNSKLSFVVSYFDGSGLDASERRQSLEADKRLLLDSSDPFYNHPRLRNNSAFGIYGEFVAGTPDTSSDYINGQAVHTLTGEEVLSSSGRFHMQPIGVFDNPTQSGYAFSDNLELDSGRSTTSDLETGNGIDNGLGVIVNPLRYNQNLIRRIIPDVTRTNFMVNFSHQFTDNLHAFGDIVYYKSNAYKFFGPPVLTTSNNFTVPASYIYNPFGPEVLSDGSANTNRLSGLDTPSEGLDLQIKHFRFLDLGPRWIDVDQTQYRLLAGVGGDFKGWSWESAFTYSKAKASDTGLLVSRSRLYDNLTSGAGDSFNFFAGPDVDQSMAAQSFGVDVIRRSVNSLKTWDLKFSHLDLFTMPAGDVGAAFGLEWRREEINDDRDERLDGTTTFTNPVTGEFFSSDILGVSNTPDMQATRNVYSFYGELLAPIIKDSKAIKSFDIQLATRFEHYSDIQESIMKPRISASLQMNDWVQFRGAWSKGFRAPNLVQVGQPEFSRFSNFQVDHARCSAIGECDNRAVVSLISGNADLEPETSTNISLGMVFTPEFVGGLTLTVDYWRVRQNGSVGTISRNDQIVLDEYLRRTTGAGNSNVVRASVTNADVTDFVGSGTAPFGEILYVKETFLNLQSRTVSGLDANIIYRHAEQPWGQIVVTFNAAYLHQFNQDPLPDLEMLTTDEVAAERLDEATYGDLLRIESRPKLRFNISALWKYQNWRVSLNGRYVGSVEDRDIFIEDINGDRQYFQVNSWFTVNGLVDYTFTDHDLRLRFGIKNLFDRLPPLFDNSAGYNAGTHSIRGREIYMGLRKNF